MVALFAYPARADAAAEGQRTPEDSLPARRDQRLIQGNGRRDAVPRPNSDGAVIHLVHLSPAGELQQGLEIRIPDKKSENNTCKHLPNQ